MHCISELTIYSVINFSWWQWKRIALHAKLILVFTECTKHVWAHYTRYWVRKIPQNLKDYIWSCSIINSDKLYSWCALWQSSLLHGMLCGKQARKSRNVSRFLVVVSWFYQWDINPTFFASSISESLQCFCNFSSLSRWAVDSSSVAFRLFWSSNAGVCPGLLSRRSWPTAP